jgi:hypothetical protein
VRERFLELPVVYRWCLALGIAFALTQVEAAYERHREFQPIVAAEQAAAVAGEPVASLPFDLTERWLATGVGEQAVRERWVEGNRHYAHAYDAVAGTADGSDRDVLETDRCYHFPVTGEVRTRIRGAVYVARFCFDGEAMASAPVAAEVRAIDS